MNTALNFEGMQENSHDEVVWVSPKRGGGSHSTNDTLLEARVSIYHSKNPEKARDQFAIGLTSAVMKKMRWVVGDYALLGHSNGGRKLHIELAKKKGDGFAVTSAEPDKARRAASVGTSIKSVIKMSISADSPLFAWDGPSRTAPVVISEDGRKITIALEDARQ